MTHNFEHLQDTVDPEFFAPWQEVDIEIYEITYLGMTVVINDEYLGLVYKNEIYDDYQVGDKLTGYIKCVRDDGRIDVSLQPDQRTHVFLTTEKILAYLKAAGGKSSFNDKSSPEDIKTQFQVSKMMFKRALSTLYKQGKIIISPQGIERVK